MPYSNIEDRRSVVNRWYEKNGKSYHSHRMATDPKYRQRKRDASRWTRRKLKYGITKEQWQRVWEKQNGLCAICGVDLTKERQIDIDHDHKTGAFRGILCNDCNVGIARFKDNPSTLTSASRYLLST